MNCVSLGLLNLKTRWNRSALANADDCLTNDRLSTGKPSSRILEHLALVSSFHQYIVNMTRIQHGKNTDFRNNLCDVSIKRKTLIASTSNRGVSNTNAAHQRRVGLAIIR